MFKLHRQMHPHKTSAKFDYSWPCPIFQGHRALDRAIFWIQPLLCCLHDNSARNHRRMFKLHRQMHPHKTSAKFDYSWPCPIFQGHRALDRAIFWIQPLLCCLHDNSARNHRRMFKLHRQMHPHKTSAKFDYSWPCPIFQGHRTLDRAIFWIQPLLLVITLTHQALNPGIWNFIQGCILIRPRRSSTMGELALFFKVTGHKIGQILEFGQSCLSSLSLGKPLTQVCET